MQLWVPWDTTTKQMQRFISVVTKSHFLMGKDLVWIVTSGLINCLGTKLQEESHSFVLIPQKQKAMHHWSSFIPSAQENILYCQWSVKS